MFGWLVGIVGVIGAVVLGLDGLQSVTAENALSLCVAFALIVVATLLVVASKGSSRP